MTLGGKNQAHTWTMIAGATNEGVMFNVNLDVNTERCTQHPFSSPSRVWSWSTTHCLLCRSMSTTTSLGSTPAPKKHATASSDVRAYPRGVILRQRFSRNCMSLWATGGAGKMDLSGGRASALARVSGAVVVMMSITKGSSAKSGRTGTSGIDTCTRSNQRGNVSTGTEKAISDAATCPADATGGVAVFAGRAHARSTSQSFDLYPA